MALLKRERAEKLVASGLGAGGGVSKSVPPQTIPLRDSMMSMPKKADPTSRCLFIV